jgi:hypothetical protein
MNLAYNLDALIRYHGSERLPKAPPEEVAKVVAEFKARGITYYRVAKALNVSATAARNWYLGKISYLRLAQLQELLDKVLEWETKNGRRFGT